MSWPIGKTYDGGMFPIVASEFLAYAEATDDGNARYRGDDAVAPPMYHVRPFIKLMLDMARDPELDIDMLRLVHGEHGMTFLAPLSDGDDLHIEGELTDVAEKSSGTIFTFALRGTVGDTRVLEGTTAYFVRAPKKPDAAARPKKKKPAPEAPPPATWSVDQPVTEDQALRYAPASGDDNPIHTDPEVAKKAGLPGCILHGLCTLAFASRDLVDKGVSGDPVRLKAINARFTGMVMPGETLNMQVWGDSGEVKFSTANAKGRPVLMGTAELG